jgi:hypothetical protein
VCSHAEDRSPHKVTLAAYFSAESCPAAQGVDARFYSFVCAASSDAASFYICTLSAVAVLRSAPLLCCVSSCSQGPGTDPQTVQTIRDAIKTGDEITVRILNYKRSGTPFWNMFTLAPMKDSDDTIRFLVGVQVCYRVVIFQR